MNLQFLFLTGDRQNQTATIDTHYATLGRHPLCTVPFDGHQDLDVSSRHAAVFRERELFVLRDLGSTNGTFVNGRRLRADHILANEDLVRFGQQGPEFRVTLTPDETLPYQPVAPSPIRFSTIPPRRTEEDTAPIEKSPPRVEKATRVDREVTWRAPGLRRALWILGVLLAGLAIAMVWLRAGGAV